jgi:hypothetical protein
LRDRARALPRAFAAHIDDQCANDASEVHAVMLVKARVFRRDHRRDER